MVPWAEFHEVGFPPPPVRSMMSDHRTTVAAARPIVTRGIRNGAVEVRPGQNVVPVRRIAAAVYHGAGFGEHSLLGQVVVAVQLIGHSRPLSRRATLCHGSSANPISRIDRPFVAARRCAQVGPPHAIRGTRGRRELLAVVSVCAFEARPEQHRCRARARYEKTDFGRFAPVTAHTATINATILVITCVP